MFEQRIAKHTLNSVLEISKLIPFSLCSKTKLKTHVSLCSHKRIPFSLATRLREISNGYSVIFCSSFRLLKISATVKSIITDFFQSCENQHFQTKIPLF